MMDGYSMIDHLSLSGGRMELGHSAGGMYGILLAW